MSILSLVFQRKKVVQFPGFWSVTTVLPNMLKNIAGQCGDGREEVTHICITYITDQIRPISRACEFTARAQQALRNT